MKDILYIVELINKSNLDINSLGIIEKKIGSRVYINTHLNSIQNISIYEENGVIKNIGITLKEELSLLEIKKTVEVPFVSKFNHYDQETYLSFKLQKCILHLILQNYISHENLSNLYIKRILIEIF